MFAPIPTYRSIGSIGPYDSPYDNASYNVSMPTVPPQTWSFTCFIHLKDGQAAKPQLIVYWDGSPLESDEVAGMEKHEAEGDVEFTLLVTRTITEDQFNRSTKHFQFSVTGEHKESAIAVLARLKQTNPGEFEKFSTFCWELVPGFPERFPQIWPTY